MAEINPSQLNPDIQLSPQQQRDSSIDDHNPQASIFSSYEETGNANGIIELSDKPVIEFFNQGKIKQPQNIPNTNFNEIFKEQLEFNFFSFKYDTAKTQEESDEIIKTNLDNQLITVNNSVQAFLNHQTFNTKQKTDLSKVLSDAVIKSQPMTHSLRYSGGAKLYERYKNGCEIGYFENGAVSYRKDSKGNEIHYSQDGKVILERYSSGVEINYYPSGNKCYERFKDNTMIIFNDSEQEEQAKVESHYGNNIKYSNGSKVGVSPDQDYITALHATGVRFFIHNNDLSFVQIPNGEKETYQNGKIESRNLKSSSFVSSERIKYSENGTLLSHENENGMVSFDENGTVDSVSDKRYRIFASSTKLPNGQKGLTYHFQDEDTEIVFDNNGKFVSATDVRITNLLKDLPDLKIIPGDCNNPKDLIKNIEAQIKQNPKYQDLYTEDIDNYIENNYSYEAMLIKLCSRVLSRDYDIEHAGTSDAREYHDANGKIDKDYKQGMTGDCWFISALHVMMKHNESMLNEMIENIKDSDGNTEALKITFNKGKENEKVYTVPMEQIHGASEFSSGDEDVRALEIATEQYLHDIGAESDGLNGNSLDTAFDIFFPQSDDSKEITEAIKTKEDKTHANLIFDQINKKLSQGNLMVLFAARLPEQKPVRYKMSNGITKTGIKTISKGSFGATDKQGKPIVNYERYDSAQEKWVSANVLKRERHALALSKIEDGYVYFTDPQEGPDVMLRMTVTAFQEFDVYATEIKDNKHTKLTPETET